jgi:hypothetical protein
MNRSKVAALLRERRPSPAMCVALLALFVACGGTAIAAGVLITSSRQIKDGVVTGSKLANRTVKDANIARNTIASDVIANGTIGTNKLTADAVHSLQSSGSTAYEFFRKAGPENIASGNSMRVVTADNVPAGVYAIFGKAIVTDLEPPANLLIPGHTADAHCALAAGGDIDTGDVLIGGAFGSGPGDVYTQITHTFSGPGTISLDCNAGSTWRASDSTIIAVRLGDANRTQVSG